MLYIFSQIKTENDEVKFFIQKSSSKSSSVDIKCSFDNPDSIFFCQTSVKFSLKVREWETFLFLKNLFPQNVPLDNQIEVLKSLPKSFHKKIDNFQQLKSENDEKKCNFFRKTTIETF